MYRYRLGIFVLAAALGWFTPCANSATISFVTSGLFSSNHSDTITSPSGVTIKFVGSNYVNQWVADDESGAMPLSLGTFQIIRSNPNSSFNLNVADIDFTLDISLTDGDPYPASLVGSLEGMINKGASAARIDFGKDPLVQVSYLDGPSINYELIQSPLLLRSPDKKSTSWTVELTANVWDPPTITNPEPASLLLLGTGLVAIALWRKRR